MTNLQILIQVYQEYIKRKTKIIYNLFFKRCRFPITCIPYATYKKVNPSSQIIIDGQCSDGCSTSTNVSYTFSIYYTDENGATLSSSPLWLELNSTNSEYLSGFCLELNKTFLKFLKFKKNIFKIHVGIETAELTMFPSLFDNLSSIFYWRIDLSVSYQGFTGTASLTLKKNNLPSNGTCYCQETNGTGLLSYFNVICTNWIDLDGSISSYQFMGTFLK